jgi:hypothetical protein
MAPAITGTVFPFGSDAGQRRKQTERTLPSSVAALDALHAAGPARAVRSVVGEVEHDRVVRELEVVQLFEDAPTFQSWFSSMASAQRVWSWTSRSGWVARSSRGLSLKRCQYA